MPARSWTRRPWWGAAARSAGTAGLEHRRVVVERARVGDHLGGPGQLAGAVSVLNCPTDRGAGALGEPAAGHRVGLHLGGEPDQVLAGVRRRVAGAGALVCCDWPGPVRGCRPQRQAEVRVRGAGVVGGVGLGVPPGGVAAVGDGLAGVGLGLARRSWRSGRAGRCRVRVCRRRHPVRGDRRMIHRAAIPGRTWSPGDSPASWSVSSCCRPESVRVTAVELLSSPTCRGSTWSRTRSAGR